MSLVFITIPGDAQRAFANNLHRETGGALDLVIIQKPRRKTLLERIKRHWQLHGWGIIGEAWYAVLLRLNIRARRALGYFREHLLLEDSSVERFQSKVLEVDSVNSDEVREMLSKISPDLIVVWASDILKPEILKTARRSVNLHFGLCPHYRGALANQHAVLRDDISKIGATILYINGKPDTGEILSTISACHTLPPKELFQDLNERASTRYLEVVKRLHAGEEWTTTSQEMKSGANLLLKHWTPRMRYNLGKKIVEWERRHDA